MPVVTNLEELTSLLGGVIASEDPLAQLTQQGFTLAPQLRDALDAAKPTKPLSADQRKRFAEAAGRLGTVRFNVRPR